MCWMALEVSLLFDELDCKAAKAQPFPQLLSDAFRENDAGPLPDCLCRGRCTCGNTCTAFEAGLCVITRNGQERGELAGADPIREDTSSACDLPLIIDASAKCQEERRVRRNERIEIRHHAVLPKKGAAVEVHVARNANHLAFIVNVEGYAVRVPWKRSEVGHHGVLPEESVRGCFAGQVRLADYLPRVIDGVGGVEHHAAEASQVGYGVVLPQHGVTKSWSRELAWA